MEERLIFSHKGVSVSPSRFTVNGKTYLIKDVTSVLPSVLAPKRGFARLCIFGGLFMLFGSGSLPIIGLSSMGCGATLWYSSKPRYAIILHSPESEVIALISEDSQDIENVVSALNLAIVMTHGITSRGN